MTDVLLNNPLTDKLIEHAVYNYVERPKQETYTQTISAVKEFFGGNFYGTNIYDKDAVI